MSDRQASYFRKRLRHWGIEHCRDFPWRNFGNPYGVLVAELMLRRTRADQVVPVFLRFMERFPTPEVLAGSDPRVVESIVRPLGLNWRLASFQQVAASMVETHNGQVPGDPATLMTLPGVGEYVTAAVRIFAFNQPAILADTNTVRVAGRYFGFEFHAESRRLRHVRDQIGRLLEPRQARRSATALLDFAAAVCTARAPHCRECPVATRCMFWSSRKLVEGGSV